MDNYDAIIIGAGLGGLTTGAAMAQKGKKVLMLEMHDKVGGFATKFSRKGFTFDVSLHNMGAVRDCEIMDRVFKELGLYDDVNYLQFEAYQKIVFPEHDYLVTKGVDKFVAYLVEHFPQEKKGIEELFNIMKDIRAEFDEIEALDTTIDKLDEVYPMLPIKFPMLVKLVYTTFEELMEQYIKDEKLKGLVGNLWWIYGMPPSKVASILYSVPTMGYYQFAGGAIEGTSQKLSDAIAAKIEAVGGKIILNCEVKEIIIEDNRAVGVITTDGKEYRNEIIISNASAYETFVSLIDETKIKKRYRKKIANLDLSLSATQLYLGLDCTAEELGMSEHNITLFESYNHNDNYEKVLEGDYEHSFFSCTNYTKFDKSLAPEGKGVVSVMTLDHIKNWEELSREDYLAKKEDVKKILLKKLEKIMPGVSSHVEVAELGTPMTMKRYTLTPEGSIYGASQIVEQSGVNRLNPKTFVENLYIVGSGIYPGGGYSSVISSGYKVGNMLAVELEQKENVQKA